MEGRVADAGAVASLGAGIHEFLLDTGGKAFWSERGYMFADAFQDYIGLDLMARKPHEKAKPWGAFELSNADRPGAEARQ